MLAEGLTVSTFWITSCSVGRFPLRTGLSGVAWSQRREQLVWPRLGLLVRSTYDRRIVAKGSANRGLHDAHLEAGSYLRSAVVYCDRSDALYAPLYPAGLPDR